MKNWKPVVNEHAIRPIQKFEYTKGKNSTDTALIIDAMDLLHSKLVQGFCIVSSDSDYTGLATRIREEGLFVMGIGRAHTPIAFIKACEQFTFLEVLIPLDEGVDNEKNVLKSEQRSPKGIGKTDPKTSGQSFRIIGSLKDAGSATFNQSDVDRAFEMSVDINTGLALLSRFSEALRKIDSAFDPRNFGYKTFRNFCESLGPLYVTILHKDGQTISIKRNEQ